MKTILKILFLSGIIGITAFSCGNEKQPLPYPLPTDHLTAKEAFPNQVGDRWTYSVFDSTTQTTQTVEVKIVGDTIFENGEKFKIWEYRFPDKIDTEYVNIVGDTVRLNKKYGFFNTMYIFPLYPGKSWLSGNGTIHTATVEKIETITVPAGIFKNSYDIKTKNTSYNYALIIDNWFKPKVGIIQKYIYEFNMAPPDRQTWKLVNYKLTNQN